MCVRVCVCARECTSVREAPLQLSNQMTDRISQSLLMPYDTAGRGGSTPALYVSVSYRQQ